MKASQRHTALGEPACPQSTAVARGEVGRRAPPTRSCYSFGMTNSPSATRLARFAWLTLAVTFVVIVWGAVVRATGSGAGCGNHWPLCNGEVIPPSPTVATLIELSHRITSGLSLLMVLVILGWSRRVFAPRHPAGTAAWVAMGVMLLEAGNRCRSGQVRAGGRRCLHGPCAHARRSPGEHPTPLGLDLLGRVVERWGRSHSPAWQRETGLGHRCRIAGAGDCGDDRCDRVARRYPVPGADPDRGDGNGSRSQRATAHPTSGMAPHARCGSRTR